MRLAIVFSRASIGMVAPLVTVEVHISNGLPKFNIVGLAEKGVKESKDRVRSAILNSQFDFPCRYITVNLAPADLPKEGGRFDLPIAIGILAASGQLRARALTQYECIGELALSGEIRPIQAVLPVVLGCKQSGRTLIVPCENTDETKWAKGAKIIAARHLLEVAAHLNGEASLPTVQPSIPAVIEKQALDLADVKGQAHAKRALEIAASGNHNLLFIGPPGTGKSMLAARMPSLIPPLTEDEAMESAAIASLSGHGFNPKSWQSLPFRAPHHTASSIALVGGGRPPRPGEVSLAHHGILFLDELAEFSRHALECLREPLESGHITISRAGIQNTYPAQFQLIAAMNPCPCGYAGSANGQCECTLQRIKNYLAKISGPLLERIDMHIHVERVPETLLIDAEYVSESSELVRKRVIAARARQFERQGKLNAQLSPSEIKAYSVLDEKGKSLLIEAAKRFSFSARTINRLQKVARTLADLAQSEQIRPEHLAEVIQYRALDRIKSMS